MGFCFLGTLDLIGKEWKTALSKPFGRGGVSTCHMVTMNLLRRLGVNSDKIVRGYRAGEGISVAMNYAKSIKPKPAWIRPDGANRPRPGDVLYYDQKGGGHSETVIGWEGSTIRCIAGGQVGAGGLQAIKTVSRVWANVRCGAIASDRSVTAWIDIDLLDYSGTLVVPEDWEDVVGLIGA